MSSSNYITLKSRLKIKPFRNETEKDGYRFVKTKDGQIFKFNHNQYIFLSHLKQNMTIEQSANFAKMTESDAFLLCGQLQNYNLLDHQSKSPKPSDSGWNFNPQQIFTILFFGLGIISIGILSYLLTVDTNLYPRSHDLFFSPYLSINLFSAMCIGYLLAFGHELAHALIAFSQGVRDITFRISSRLYYIVFETVMSDVYLIKESKRYPIYLAGITFDIIIMSFLAVIAHTVEANSFWYMITKQALLIQFLALVWECMIFLKTDVYFLIVDFLDIEDFEYFKHVNFHKFKQAIMYSIMILGNAFAMYQFIRLILPAKYAILNRASHYVFSRSPVLSLDGLIALATELISSALLLYVFTKKISGTHRQFAFFSRA